MSSILTLDILDVVEGLGILVGQRRILICDAVELGLDLVELGLGGIQFIGGFFGSLRRMGASGQAKKNCRRSGAEQGLEGSAARELLGKGWNRCLVTYVLRYMLIYMSLNSYILAYIRRIPTISTNGSKPCGRRLICKRQGRGYAHAKHFHEYVSMFICFSCPAHFGCPCLRYTPLKKCS